MSKEIDWLIKEKYGGVRSKKAVADIERIKQGEPLAYVIGFAEFLGCQIDLSQRTLIPRPETEFWVEQAILNVQSSALDKIKCLDIFAGSGCVGVSILKNIPEVTIDFVDSEDNALEQIRINTKLNNIDSARYKIIKSNIFENVVDKYDYIFTNPPYIAEDDEEIELSVLKYEPHQALFAGKDGFKYIKTFLGEAEKYLNKNGKIFMEFGRDQKDTIEKISDKINFYQDQFRKWRYLELQP